MVNELISKKDLMIQAFSVYYPLEGENYIKVIRLEDVEKAPTEPRWIPVSERLPNSDEYIKSNGLFIVSDRNRSYSAWYDIYNRQRFGKPTISGFRIDYAVIAWMPLPEPYTEVKDEKED